MNKNNQDKKLFFRIKKKDHEAFLQAYDLYVDDIYRFVYFKIGHEEEAQDITSAVFLKVWNYLQSQILDEAKSLRAFLYKVARNLVIDRYRQLKETEVSINEELKNTLADESQNVFEQVEKVLDLEKIKESLSDLKDEYREIILLRYVDELSFPEIAEITGKTAGTVRVLSFRALQALKSLLEEKEK